MRSLYCYILTLTGLGIAIFADAQPMAVSIKWYSFAQAATLVRQTPKKILVDTYTDWCGWCKKMDATTYKDPRVVAYLNANFYPVKLNAEQKEDIILGKDTLRFIPSGQRGYHQLAAILLNNQLGYPCTTLLNEKLQMVAIVPGYQTSLMLMPWLQYMVKEDYLRISPQQFSEDLQKKSTNVPF
jgi:thioredoxin-related protein